MLLFWTKIYTQRHNTRCLTLQGRNVIMRSCIWKDDFQARHLINERVVLTWRKAALSVSLRASMQNCRRAVVCCNRVVQVATWSFNARILNSLSCRMHSISCALLAWIAATRFSHWAVTILSNSTQFSWN